MKRRISLVLTLVLVLSLIPYTPSAVAASYAAFPQQRAALPLEWFPPEVNGDNPDNIQGWEFRYDSGAYPLSALKDAQFLVLEVPQKPLDGTEILFIFNDGDWYQTERWEHQVWQDNGDGTGKLFFTLEWMNGYNEMRDAGLFTFVNIGYWGDGSGDLYDLGVTSAYLTFPVTYDVSDAADKHNVLGFDIQVTNNHPWDDNFNGNMSVPRPGHQHGDVNVGWRSDGYVYDYNDSTGTGTLRFRFNWEILDESDPGSVILSAQEWCDVTFGELTYVYDRTQFPEDIQPGHWSYDAVMFLYNDMWEMINDSQWGLSGYFCPEVPMARRDFARIIYRLAGGMEPAGYTDQMYDDLGIGHWEWFRTYAAFALEEGYMSLIDDGHREEFRPHDDLTWGAFKEAMWELFGYTVPYLSWEPQDEWSINNVNVALWLADAIWQQAGMNGRNDIFQYDLGTPGVVNNAWQKGWATNGLGVTSSVSIATLRHSRYLVLEVEEKPAGGIQFAYNNFVNHHQNPGDNGWKWQQQSFTPDELWDGDKLIFDLRNMPFDIDWEYLAAKFYICYYDDVWEDLGVTRAYLTNEQLGPEHKDNPKIINTNGAAYFPGQGWADGAYVFDVLADISYDDMLRVTGFQIELDGADLRNYWYNGGIQIFRFDDDPDEGHNWRTHWNDETNAAGRNTVEIRLPHEMFHEHELNPNGPKILFEYHGGFSDIEVLGITYLYDIWPFGSDMIGHWAYDSAVYLHSINLIQSEWNRTGYYFPNRSVNREELSNMLGNLVGVWWENDTFSGVTNEDFLADIGRGDDHTRYVNGALFALENGYMLPVEAFQRRPDGNDAHELPRIDGQFGRWEPLTREQLCRAMAVLLGYVPGSYVDTSILDQFADGSEIGADYRAAVAWMAERGHINDNGHFNPKDHVNRATLAFMVANTLQELQGSGEFALDWPSNPVGGSQISWATNHYGQLADNPYPAPSFDTAPDISIVNFMQSKYLVLEMDQKPAHNIRLIYQTYVNDDNYEDYPGNRLGRGWHEQVRSFSPDECWDGEKVVIDLFHAGFWMDWGYMVAKFSVAYDGGDWDDLGVDRAYLTNEALGPEWSEHPKITNANGNHDREYVIDVRAALNDDDKVLQVTGFQLELEGANFFMHGYHGGLEIIRSHNDWWGFGWNNDGQNSVGKNTLEYRFDHRIFYDLSFNPTIRFEYHGGFSDITIGEITWLYDMPDYPSDLGSSQWARDDILYLDDLRIMGSEWGRYGYFFPDKTVSRETLAEILGRLNGVWDDWTKARYHFGVYQNGDNWEYKYDDVNFSGMQYDLEVDIRRDDAWYVGYALYALENGYMLPVTGPECKPNGDRDWGNQVPNQFHRWGDLTREQLFLAMAVLLDYNPAGGYGGAAAYLISKGIITDDSNPQGRVTRVELAVILARTLRVLQGNGVFELTATPTYINNPQQKGWATQGWEQEGIAAADVSIIHLIQSNYLVLEMDERPSGGLQFVYQHPQDGWQQRDLRADDLWDGQKIVFDLKAMDYWVPHEMAAKFLVCYYDDVWEDLGVTRAYLSVADPRLPQIPGPGYNGFDRYDLGRPTVTDGITKVNYRGWSTGNNIADAAKGIPLDVMRAAETLTLECPEPTVATIDFVLQTGVYTGNNADLEANMYKWWQHRVLNVAEIYSNGKLTIPLRDLSIQIYPEDDLALMQVGNMGINWYDLGVTAAYLTGDFRNAFFDDPNINRIYHSSFEGGKDGFEASWGANLDQVTTPQAQDGDYSLRITNRSESWHAIEMNTRAMMLPGNTYYVSGWVRQDTGAPQDIRMTLAYDGPNYSGPYVTVGSATCTSGQWTKIEGTVVILDSPALNRVYFEMGGSLADFYVDNVEIWGPAPPAPPPNPWPDIYSVPSSLKDAYKDLFKIGVAAVTLSHLKDKNVLWHIKQHYNVIYLVNPSDEGEARVILDAAGAADIEVRSSATHTLDHYILNPGMDAQAYKTEMATLISNPPYPYTAVIINNLYELFDTGRFIPNDAYYTVLRAPLTGGSVITGTNVIINQVYGAGTPRDGSVSHSFIELHNPTDSPISMNSYSIQIANAPSGGTTGDWLVLPLTGKTIGARSSFLIVFPEYVNTTIARYIIPHWDMEWPDVELSNRAYSVALVDNQAKLSQTIEPGERAHVIDMVSAINSGETVLNIQGSGTPRISKQLAARRKTFANTGDNMTDFIAVDYRSSGISDAKLAEMRPRYSGDGAWGRDVIVYEEIAVDRQLMFSQDAGFYNNGFTLGLGTDYAVGTIWYTTDGSDPVPYSWGAKQYTVPIAITDRTNEPNYFAAIGHDSFLFGESGDEWFPDRGANGEWGRNQGHYRAPKDEIFKSNIIRAQVYYPDGTPLSKAVTKSYIIENGISDLFDGLPVISVAIDEADLYDNDTGIFVNGHHQYSGAEWERRAHMEFFETDRELAFAQNLGVRIHGGWSRMNPQKSLRFYASASRDPDHPTVDHDMFAGNALDINGDPIVEFRRFMLRNFGNDNGGAYMRDLLIHQYSQGLNMATMDSRYAVLLLNGEFWGLYEIRERIDEYFVESNYGVSSGKAAILTNPFWWDDSGFPDDFRLYRDMVNWLNDNTSLADPAKYEEAQRYIDIDSLIDFFAVRIYANDEDWPGNNTEMWRYQTDDGYPATGAALSYTDGRWRYILKDVDMAFNIYSDNQLGRNYLNDLLNDGGESTLLFRRFCTNPDFMKKFVNRYFDLMNTHMNPVYIDQLIDGFVNQIQPVMGLQNQRWRAGDANNDGGWLGNVTGRIKVFNDQRQANMISHILTQWRFNLSGAAAATLTLRTDSTEGHIRVNDMDITEDTLGVTDPSNWSGTYLTNLGQTVTAVPASGYLFDKFIVNGIEYDQNPLDITMIANTTVQAVFAEDVPEPDRDEFLAFRYIRATANVAQPSYPATDGLFMDTASMEFFYANGAQANLGRTQADREPVNVPNNAGRWTPASGIDAEIDANNSAGWIITLDTRNYENIIFTADQGSSNNGPRDFKLAYRLGTTGPFIEIGGDHTPILSAQDNIGRTFIGVSLPAGLEDQPVVQLKVYISSNASRGTGAFDPAGGNTSINNIVFEGIPIVPGWTPPVKRDITIDTMTNGTVTAPATVEVGEIVTLTVAPHGNYKLAPGSLKFNGNVVAGNTFTMPDADVTVTADFAVINTTLGDSPVIINQVYGGSSSGAVSHSFIELYNTSNTDVNMNGWSVQVANAAGNNLPTGDWIKLDLTGKTIKANSYFLIVCTPAMNAASPRYTIPNGEWDMAWAGGTVSNRGVSVALVSNQTKLTEVITEPEWMNVLDLVGANNTSETIKNFLGADVPRLSASQAIRRKDYQNTGVNAADFESVRYANDANGISDDRLLEVRPRWSGDGSTAPDVLTFMVGNVKARTGGYVEVPIFVLNNPGMSSITGLIVSWDSDKLMYDDRLGIYNPAAPAGMSTWPFTVPAVYSMDGIFAYNTFTAPAESTAKTASSIEFGFGATANSVINGTLVIMKFKVKDGVDPGDIDIKLSLTSVKNQVGALLDFDLVDGAVTVSNIEYGNVKGYGDIDYFDVTLLLQYLAKWDVAHLVNLDNANVKGYGDIDYFDVTLLLQYLAKWDVTLGPPTP